MVGAIRRHWTLCESGMLIAYGAVAAVAWLLLMVAADNILILSRGQLFGGWALLGFVVLAWAGLFAWRLVLRRPEADDLALMYETRAAGFGNRLINSVQFLRFGLVASDPMAYAAVLENVPRLDPKSAPVAVDHRPLRNAALAFAGAALLMVAYALVLPGWTKNAMQRIASPWSPPAHRLATQIEVSPGSVLVPEGGRIVVEAELAGCIPDEAHVRYRRGKGDWITVAMERTDRTRYRFPGLTALNAPTQYQVLAGRSESPVYDISIRYGPKVAFLQAKVVRPEYAGSTERILPPNKGDIAALHGAKVSLKLAASNPLKLCYLMFDDERRIDAGIVSGEPKSASASMVLTNSGTYTIHLVDDGDMSNARVPRYSLTVLPDQAPTVAVTKPGRDLILPADGDLGLEIEAGDDVGIGRMILQTRFGEDAWSINKEWRFEGPTVAQKVVAHTVSLKELGMKSDQTLLYRVVVLDKSRPYKNRTVGRTWSVMTELAAGSKAVMALREKRRLVDLLENVLKLQKANRKRFATGGPVGKVRSGQEQIRSTALKAVLREEKSAQPNKDLVSGLRDLVGSEMLLCLQGVRKYETSPSDDRKNSLLQLMDKIVARLETLLRESVEDLAKAAKLAPAMEHLSAKEREEMVEEILAEMEKLGKFVEEQTQAMDDVKKVSTKAASLRPEDIERIKAIENTEDKWGEIFNESIEKMEKLAAQDFADGSVLRDYKELLGEVEKAEEALGNINKSQEGATSKGGDFKFVFDTMLDSTNLAMAAQQKLGEMLASRTEMDRTLQEESAMNMEIDDTDVPEELYDMAGELAEEDTPPLQADEEQEKEYANFWRNPESDKPPNQDWDIDDGPTSEFSAQSQTGEKAPDDNVLSGRAGDGREGRSEGQMVGKVSKALPGRQPPAKLTDDPFEEGVIEQLREKNVGGSTGGGKASGSGQEGLEAAEGHKPPPEYKGLEAMKDWRKKIKDKNARGAGPIRAMNVALPHQGSEYERVLQLLVEANKEKGRYGADEMQIEEMMLPRLYSNPDVDAEGAYRHIEPAYPMPDEMRQRVVDPGEEPVPEEYDKAQQRYFKQLSGGDME